LLPLNIWVAPIYSNKKEVTRSRIDNEATKMTENSIENIRENVIQDTKEKIKSTGIITQTYAGNTYIFWHIADVVYPYISQFLSKEFPNSVIIREFNKIDYVVLKENLPIEIQSTIAYRKTGGQRNGISHSEFEQKIEKQIKQNIDRYEKCWFFFDSEYLRYLQDNITKSSRINLDWLFHYMKEKKLRIFVVKYDGIIRELSDNDFSFLPNISRTCTVGMDEDFRILDRNKFKIMSNVLEGYKFTTNEIDKMYNTFKLSEHKGFDKGFDKWLSRDGHNGRDTEYFYISHAVTTLKDINNMLDCKIDEKSYIRTYSHYMKVLGLIETKDTGKVGYMRIFVDKFDIAQYFPGYLRNKELWDDLRNRYISYDTLCAMVTGKVDINWWKKQKSIVDAWQ